MIGHLGPRVSALLDGQLAPAEAERAWAHVHACHFCRDLVEREGWIKTRLAGLAHDDDVTPDSLKGALAHGSFLGAPPAAPHPAARPRSSMLFLGGTAVGAAMAGVIALGVAPGGTPAERRPPVTSLNGTSATPDAAGPTGLRLPTLRAAGGIAGVKMVP